MHPLAPPAAARGLDEESRLPRRVEPALPELSEVIAVVRVGQGIEVAHRGRVRKTPAGKLGLDAGAGSDAGQVRERLTRERAARELREDHIRLARDDCIYERELTDR